MAKRTCPDCGCTMQVFHAGAVELDRCLFCRGLWFDGGELDQVLGKPVRPEPMPGSTNRKCAACQTLMSTAMLAGHPVELCRSCRGIYLDKGELQAINGGQVRIQRAAAPVITFCCIGCAQDFPLEAGTHRDDGLACPRCAPGLPSKKAHGPGENQAELESINDWFAQLGL